MALYTLAGAAAVKMRSDDAPLRTSVARWGRASSRWSPRSAALAAGLITVAGPRSHCRTTTAHRLLVWTSIAASAMLGAAWWSFDRDDHDNLAFVGVALAVLFGIAGIGRNPLSTPHSALAHHRRGGLALEIARISAWRDGDVRATGHRLQRLRLLGSPSPTGPTATAQRGGGEPMTAYEREAPMRHAHRTEALFHGKFIADDPHRLPLTGRIAIGIGVGLAIFVMAALCLNVLNSWGVWVTLLIISTFTTTSLTLWIRDARLHPADLVDHTE